MTWSDARIPHSAGALDPEFEPVGEAFADNFSRGDELGASFAVMIDGRFVVDIRGGHADKVKETPWTEDTLTCVYSSGKAVIALLIARAVSDGALDYDAPIAKYWPEFAAAGKEKITIAEALSHQAGLCGFPDEMSPETWLDWDAIAGKIAAMEPLWEPGAAHGYHPQTVGCIAGEILRRQTGKTVGALVREYADEQFLDIFCGTPESEFSRVAFMPKPPKAPDLGELNEFTRLAFLKPWSAASRVSREDWMAAEIPASNMHTNARSLAAFMQPMSTGGVSSGGETVLTKDAIDQALRERIRGDDLVLPFHLSWSAGLMRNINKHFGPNENAYGHAGFGGSCVLVDPENRLTAAYVMNKMSPHLVGDPRSVRLLNATYDCLSA